MDEKEITEAVRAAKFHLAKLQALQRAVRALKRAQRAIANSGAFVTRMEKLWDECLPIHENKMTLSFEDEVPPMEGE